MVNQFQDQLRIAGQTGLSPAEPTPQPPVTAPTNRISEDGAANDLTVGEGRSLDEILAGIEKREILSALQKANGQRTMAAQFLRISRSRLYRRMEALGIDPRTGEPGHPA